MDILGFLSSLYPPTLPAGQDLIKVGVMLPNLERPFAVHAMLDMLYPQLSSRCPIDDLAPLEVVIDRWFGHPHPSPIRRLTVTLLMVGILSWLPGHYLPPPDGGNKQLDELMHHLFRVIGDAHLAWWESENPQQPPFGGYCLRGFLEHHWGRGLDLVLRTRIPFFAEYAIALLTQVAQDPGLIVIPENPIVAAKLTPPDLPGILGRVFPTQDPQEGDDLLHLGVKLPGSQTRLSGGAIVQVLRYCYERPYPTPDEIRAVLLEQVADQDLLAAILILLNLANLTPLKMLFPAQEEYRDAIGRQQRLIDTLIQMAGRRYSMLWWDLATPELFGSYGSMILWGHLAMCKADSLGYLMEMEFSWLQAYVCQLIQQLEAEGGKCANAKTGLHDLGGGEKKSA